MVWWPWVCVCWVVPGWSVLTRWSVHSTQGIVARFCCFRLLACPLFFLPAFVCPVSCLLVVAVLACSSYGLGGFSVPTRAPGGVQDPWLGRNCLLNAALVRRRGCLCFVVCPCLFVFGSRAGIPVDVFALDAFLGPLCWVSALLLWSLWLAFPCLRRMSTHCSYAWLV